MSVTVNIVNVIIFMNKKVRLSITLKLSNYAFIIELEAQYIKFMHWRGWDPQPGLPPLTV